MAVQLQLSNVVNPANNDQMVVTQNSVPVNIGSGGQIQNGDIINAAPDASGEVVLFDTQTNEVIAPVSSFAGAEPVDIEVNWTDAVLQVDEYYYGNGVQCDITVDVGGDDNTYSIQG